MTEVARHPCRLVSGVRAIFVDFLHFLCFAALNATGWRKTVDRRGMLWVSCLVFLCSPSIPCGLSVRSPVSPARMAGRSVASSFSKTRQLSAPPEKRGSPGQNTPNLEISFQFCGP